MMKGKKRRFHAESSSAVAYWAVCERHARHSEKQEHSGDPRAPSVRTGVWAVRVVASFGARLSACLPMQVNLGTVALIGTVHRECVQSYIDSALSPKVHAPLVVYLRNGWKNVLLMLCEPPADQTWLAW
jgi:hypothetical protein